MSTIAKSPRLDCWKNELIGRENGNQNIYSPTKEQ